MQGETTQHDARRLEKTREPGIYKRGGRYVVTARARGRQVKRFARTFAEARDLKAALRADVARGEYRALSKVTFAEYAAEWIDTYAGRTKTGIRETTRDSYRREIERRAIPFFGGLRLAEVEPRDVKRYVAEVAASGVSRDTVRLALAPVRALLATALEEGLIRSNPATGIRIPAVVETESADAEQTKALTEDELGKLIEKAEPEWRLFVRLLADTGLRIGEAIALHWGDVDLGRRRLSVRRRYYKGTFAPPKSRYGRRDIPLSDGLARELWRLRQVSRSVQDGAAVFPGRGGGPLDASTAFRAVKAACRAAGVPWAGPHALRHTCATRLFRAGLNAKQVQIWLGHHSPAFTLATYVHLLADDLPEPSFFDDGANRRSEENSRRDAPTETATGGRGRDPRRNVSAL
jgi:integrase